MSREAQNVPIATLAGIANVADFLSELPLPKKAKFKDVINLFPNSKITQDAWKLVQKQDLKLATQLAQVLSQVNTDHIQFKPGVLDDISIGVNSNDPKLLALLSQHVPHLFQPQGIVSQQSCFTLNTTDLSAVSTTELSQQNALGRVPYSPQVAPLHPGVNSGSSLYPHNGTYNNQFNSPVKDYSPLKTRAMRAGKTPITTNKPHQVEEPLQDSPPTSKSNLNVNECTDKLIVKQNLNILKEFNEHPLPTKPVQMVPEATLLHNDCIKNNSSKSSDASKNGCVKENEQELEMLESHEGETQQRCLPDNSNSTASSKKNKKSKKHHKLKDDLEIVEHNLEPNGLLSTNIVPTQEVSMTDLNEKRTPIIPKLIISRTKLNSSTESNNFTIKESLKDNDDRREKNLKRRRSSEDSGSSDEKRKKSEQKCSKLSRRLSIQLEDDYRQVSSFKRFSEAMDNMFDFDDQCDLTSSMENDSQKVENEFLVTRPEISAMCTETAKLKSMKTISKIKEDDLSRLIIIMKRHVKDGMNLQLTSCQDDDEEQKLWKGLYMDRILRSFDATLLILHIMTACYMPKKVYIEEVIELMVSLIRYHLQQNIFPEYDPIYKVEPDTKDGALIATKTKRIRSIHKGKIFVELYNKICEAVSLLGDLMDIQKLTDTIVLQISSLGTSPFFVENVSELQHSALKLVRTTFRKYLKHRELILEDIFASLARLPSSKRNLRSYRVHGDECIQMVTALVLQLIQCSVKNDDQSDVVLDDEVAPDVVKMNRELDIVGSYENALRTAQNFLSMFLNKCNTAGKDQEDYRPLFENFLQDLLVTLNKNDWPAAEVLLTLLSNLLIRTFNNRSNDMGLRVASLDYLGGIAAHLRRNLILSPEQDQEDLLEIIAEVTKDTHAEQEEILEFDEADSETEQSLRRYLLKFLYVHGKNDPALLLARQFYLCQWIRDNQTELEKAYKATVPNGNEDDLPSASFHGGDSSVQSLEIKKSFLFSLIDEDTAQLRIPNSSLDYEKANLVAKFISSKRSFLKSFDLYLQQILQVLNESTVAVRTKAMKALSAIVAVDPNILARNDMQIGVHGRFMDSSISVREAAVELVGRFILNKPELTHQYYEMIMARILDTGVSVRRRVIKILKDICIAQPDFPKITEICVRMIGRINDADGVKELVTKVFQQMWFVPVEKSKTEQEDILLKRVTNIADVVTAFGESGSWLQQLLENLIKNDDESDNVSAGAKQVIEACSQIVDCLVDRLLTLEERVVAESGGKASNSRRLLGCLNTLYLMTKVQPSMVIKHATTLQPYLSTKCNTQGDQCIPRHVARILELVIPLMEHPSETFLASVEEDLMKVLLITGQKVIQSCIACLAAVVNKVTHNFKLIAGCFQRCYGCLCKASHELTTNSSQVKLDRPVLLRSLFTLGLLCKHFDFENELKTQNNDSISRQVIYRIYIYFSKNADHEISYMAITGLGFLCIRYPKLLLEDGARELYQNVLSPEHKSIKLKLQVLKNILNHLMEEENILHAQDSDWKHKSEKENLKEFGDTLSGTTSEIMQLYLKHILETFLHPHSLARSSALGVLEMILRQGLVHPVQCVSYLIAIGLDSEQGVRTKAIKRLEEIDSKHPGFVQMKALAGVKMSFELQKILHKDDPVVRGFQNDDTHTASVLRHLYLLLRSSRQHRRSFLRSLLRMLDDEKKNSLELLLYLVDNIAYFPYSTLAEPLFIIHNIDTKLSCSGINLLETFQQILLPKNTDDDIVDDDIEDNAETLLARLPENLSCIESCWKSWQCCMLLLYLRQHLKETYGLNDSKCRKYSPTESSKAYDKAISGKTGVTFQPDQPISCLHSAGVLPSRDVLIQQYLKFKTMIMNFDKSEEDSDHDSNGRDSPTGENDQEHDCQDEKSGQEVKTKEKRSSKTRKTPVKKTPGSSKGKAKPKAKKKRKRSTYDLNENSDQEFNDPDDKAYVPHH